MRATRLACRGRPEAESRSAVPSRRPRLPLRPGQLAMPASTRAPGLSMSWWCATVLHCDAVRRSPGHRAGTACPRRAPDAAAACGGRRRNDGRHLRGHELLRGPPEHGRGRRRLPRRPTTPSTRGRSMTRPPGRGRPASSTGAAIATWPATAQHAHATVASRCSRGGLLDDIDASDRPQPGSDVRHAGLRVVTTGRSAPTAAMSSLPGGRRTTRRHSSPSKLSVHGSPSDRGVGPPGCGRS